MTRGIFFTPWPAGFSVDSPSNGSLVTKWRKGVLFKSHPRDAAYMRKEFFARFPHGEWVDATLESEWLRRIQPGDDVVILYPDSIGLGFSRLERLLIRRVEAGRILALTGRRRLFQLTPQTRRALLWRRMLEWTMLPELGMSIAFLTCTPFLLLADLAKGKR